MNSRHRKTIEILYKSPIQSNIIWTEIENMLIGLGAEVTEGSGSRVRVKLNGVRAVFHRPHPEKETDKGAVLSVRRFLENAGVQHDGI